jgi:putative DNA primase/helicase
MMVLPFANSFARNPDTELDEKLRAELPGILSWAIQGWKSLRQNGRFVAPKAGSGLKNSLEESASPIHTFIAECCILNSRAKADKDELFDAWRDWCRHLELDAGKKNSFGKLLFEALPQVKNSRPIVDGRRVWLYSGIGLQEPDLAPESEPAAELTAVAHT